MIFFKQTLLSTVMLTIALHYSTFFQSATHPTGTEQLKWRTLNIYPYSYFWIGQKKLRFLQCLTHLISSLVNSTHPPDIYPLFFEEEKTQLSLYFTLNILTLSLIHNLNWKLHTSLVKSVSSKLEFLYRTGQLFPHPEHAAANDIKGLCPPLYWVCISLLFLTE